MTGSIRFRRTLSIALATAGIALGNGCSSEALDPSAVAQGGLVVRACAEVAALGAGTSDCGGSGGVDSGGDTGSSGEDASSDASEAGDSGDAGPWITPPWSQGPVPPRCLPPRMPPPGGGWPPGPGTPGCGKWLDYCAAGVAFGCNAYFFCMTAGNNPAANCARACIQSNIPPAPRPDPNGDVDPQKCKDLQDQGLDCECLYYREAACIDGCKARGGLPWGVNPTLDRFWPACGAHMDLEIILNYLCPDRGGSFGGKTCAQILDDIARVRPAYPCSVTLK